MSAPCSPVAGGSQNVGSHSPTKEQLHHLQLNNGNESLPLLNITSQLPTLERKPDEEDQELEAAFLDSQPSQEHIRSSASHLNYFAEEEEAIQEAADPTTILDNGVFSLPPSDTALVFRKSLVDCNLTFNRKHRAFICLHAKCEKIVGAGDLEEHFFSPKTHPAYTTLLPKEARTSALAEARMLCAEFGVDLKESTPTCVSRVYLAMLQEAGTGGACLPVEGLRLIPGVRCGLCEDHHFVYANSRILRQGHSKAAHGLAMHKIDGAIITCLWQSLNENTTCSIEGTKARLQVQPPYQALMQPVSEGNAANAANSNACKSFAAKMVCDMLAPLNLSTTAATTTTDSALLAQPTSKRHTDLILNKIGWLPSLSHTQTNIQLLSDATRGARECGWSFPGLGAVEIVADAVVHFYMQEGINDRVEREANLDLRGLIGGVPQNGFEAKGKKHFASVELPTVKKYAGVVSRTVLSVLRQACYQQYVSPALASNQEVQQQLDDFWAALPALDGDVIASAHAFVDSIMTWARNSDASFQSGVGVGVSGLKGKYGQRYSTDIQSSDIKDASVQPLLRSFHLLCSRLLFRSFPITASPLACPIERAVLGMSFSRASGFADLDQANAVVSGLKFFAKGVVFFHILPPWPQEHPLEQALGVRVYMDPDGFVDQALSTVSPFRKFVGFGRYVSTLSQDTTPIPKLIIDSSFPDGGVSMWEGRTVWTLMTSLPAFTRQRTQS